MSALTSRVTASTIGHASPTIDLTLTDSQPWMRKGSCLRLDPAELDHFFFPISEEVPALVGPAKRLCADCPVRIECLNYALMTSLPADSDPRPGPRHERGSRLRGIWGGTTTRERMQLRKHSKRRLRVVA